MVAADRLDLRRGGVGGADRRSRRGRGVRTPAAGASGTRAPTPRGVGEWLRPSSISPGPTVGGCRGWPQAVPGLAIGGFGAGRGWVGADRRWVSGLVAGGFGDGRWRVSELVAGGFGDGRWRVSGLVTGGFGDGRWWVSGLVAGGFGAGCWRFPGCAPAVFGGDKAVVARRGEVRWARGVTRSCACSQPVHARDGQAWSGLGRHARQVPTPGRSATRAPTSHQAVTQARPQHHPPNAPHASHPSAGYARPPVTRTRRSHARRSRAPEP
jgi:hypothetical protein